MILNITMTPHDSSLLSLDAVMARSGVTVRNTAVATRNERRRSIYAVTAATARRPHVITLEGDGKYRQRSRTKSVRGGFHLDAYKTFDLRVSVELTRTVINNFVCFINTIEHRRADACRRSDDFGAGIC